MSRSSTAIPCCSRSLTVSATNTSSSRRNGPVVEHLGSDVRVQTQEPKMRERGRRRDRLRHRGRGNAERGRLVTGRDRLVGVHANAGVHAEQERLHDARRGRERVQPFGARPGPSAITSPTRARTASASSSSDLLPPVEGDARGRHAGPHARFDLAAGRGQEVEPLVDGHPKHRVRAERLHGVERLREREPSRAEPARSDRPRSNTTNGVPKRSASATALAPAIHMPSAWNDAFAGQGSGATAGGAGLPAHPCRAAPSAQPSTRSMTSGAETPSRPRRFAITCFVPVASHRRAWVSASSSETTRHSV